MAPSRLVEKASEFLPFRLVGNDLILTGTVAVFAASIFLLSVTWLVCACCSGKSRNENGRRNSEVRTELVTQTRNKRSKWKRNEKEEDHTQHDPTQSRNEPTLSNRRRSGSDGSKSDKSFPCVEIFKIIPGHIAHENCCPCDTNVSVGVNEPMVVSGSQGVSLPSSITNKTENIP